MTSHTGTHPGSRFRGGLAVLFAVAALLAGSELTCAADVAPLRRAFVPADRIDAWPAGAWERVPYRQFNDFERSRSGDSSNPPPAPVIERMVFRGTLTGPSVVTGRFEAEVRRLDEHNEFLELGSITPALRNLQWSSGPAVWGTAPDGSNLLHIDRDDGQLTGEWSLHGETVFEELELDLRLFPTAAERLELTLPEQLELRCSRGVLLTPQAAMDGARTWIVELGQSAECLCRVAPEGGQPQSAPSYEGIASYTIRPDGGRLQADFNISVPAKRPPNLRFLIPPGVENPEATTAANIGLPARVEH
ncbi:MAG: hypothetical protein JNG89_13825, partial [Planctomycetaceae bacterium]|nr:hypothetical protein [Planctomycetaceae bacterium]